MSSRPASDRTADPSSGAGKGPPPGFRYLPGRLDRSAQEALLAEIRAVVRAAPLFQPVMPRTGKPLSVKMSNCGSLGWVADEAGYRYQSAHPVTGKPWPAIPQMLLDLWAEISGFPAEPEACLINFYEETARMGLHRDEDEEDFSAPVFSVSLGDTCRFRVGGQVRKDPTSSFKLASGDIVLLAGEARTVFHGVDRIYPGTSTLLKDGGRINLTLRRVRKVPV
ncbi:alkylated DNA repair protein (DNA oxidative demethylase) [Breoghania corrubedonensis]|uniref:Alkylated DNA repair protein (DNA oxidative demethylase) n=1 Tax=Breoghania corrubedonensis TaxID=665038 RepID=A0A2T5VG90_9HYPH|nr:alpha-ketoglutarate-dependent dioxygenase AlkB [Breoghania corrubedonensis]PTW62783.1 alkylated DNA repair protein (DNA oxidative demethylase) [Breoghania corrubedonensis]